MSTTEPMTREQLDAIQARLDDATSGPWGCYGDGAHEVFDAGEYSDGDQGEVVAAVIDKPSDAVFIAHAREDVPALLAEVERLRALTTVDKDMVERAARTFYEYPTPGLDASLRTDWDRLTKASPDVADNYRAHVRAVLDAALGTALNN